MYSKILVAFGEEDPLNQKVLSEATAIAAAEHGVLNLLHVLLPAEAGLPDTGYVTADGINVTAKVEAFRLYLEQWQGWRQQNQQSLGEQVNQLQAQGLTAEWSQAVGDAGRQICRVAKDWSADVIVLGRHQRSGIQEILLGSVSNYVMHHASCSVLIVQNVEAAASA
ncbi:MAG: universal stress protein [Cyanobacteria bacterium P01_H01_bin.162]